MSSRLYISMYHYVRDLKHSRYPEIKGLDIELFRKQIEFMKQEFNIISMEEVIDIIRESKEFPEKALLLTFDDGYADHYSYVFPVLEEAKIQGSFFIPGKTFATHQLLDVNKIHYILAVANIKELLQDVYERLNYYRGGAEQKFNYPSNEELFKKYGIANRFDNAETIFVKRILQTVLPEQLRNQISSELFRKYVGISEEKLSYELYMTEDQIRTLKRHGMFIGLHGYDHYWLGNLETKQMKQDIEQALEVLDEFIDRNNWVINYPYGSYNQEVVSYIQSRGACIGLTTDVRVVDISKDSRLELPRLDCNDFPPKSENYKSR